MTVIIMVAAPRVRGVALAPRHRRHQADQQGHRENVREEEGQKKQQVLMRKVGFATLARRGARRSIVPRCPAVIEARGLGLPRCPSGVGRGRGGRTARQINRQTDGGGSRNGVRPPSLVPEAACVTRRPCRPKSFEKPGVPGRGALMDGESLNYSPSPTSRSPRRAHPHASHSIPLPHGP